MKQSSFNSLHTDEVSSEAGSFFVLSELPQLYTAEEYRDSTYGLSSWWSQKEHEPEIAASKRIYEQVFPFYQEALSVFLSNENGDNKLFSPVLAYQPISMMASVADGETQKELLNALHIYDEKELSEYADIIWRMANYKVDDGISSTFSSVLATALVLDRSIYSDDISALKSVCDSFHVSAFVGDFSSKEFWESIQTWISSNVQEGFQFEGERMEDSVWSVFSILHFEVPWDSPTIAQLIEEGVFHGSNGDQDCRMMHNSEGGVGYTGSNFRAATRRLKDGSVALFVLPNEGVQNNDVLNSSDLARLLQDRDAYPNQEICEIYEVIPILNITEDINMRDGMQRMGIRTVFDPMRAELPGIGLSPHGTSLTGCEQKVSLDMNEYGISVSAANGFNGGVTGETFMLILDRPFLLFIQMPDGSIILGANINHL